MTSFPSVDIRQAGVLAARSAGTFAHTFIGILDETEEHSFAGPEITNIAFEMLSQFFLQDDGIDLEVKFELCQAAWTSLSKDNNFVDFGEDLDSDDFRVKMFLATQPAPTHDDELALRYGLFNIITDMNTTLKRVHHLVDAGADEPARKTKHKP